MARMADKPSTGDERLDAIVESQFTEAIGLVRQILHDHFPDEDPEKLDRVSALVPTQIWRSMANVFLGGIAALNEQERAQQ